MAMPSDERATERGTAADENTHMTRITLDAELRQRLLDLSAPLELCDESGAVVARVVPAHSLDLYLNPEPEVSEKEIQRRRREKGKTYSTAEVLARLESL
jgi:hypothetical protein